MTKDELVMAIDECNNGQLNFNLGSERFSFLYGAGWYPLRATVNRAREISNESCNLTKDQAMAELIKILPYIRVSEIEFMEVAPVKLKNQEIIHEINILIDMIKNVTMEC